MLGFCALAYQFIAWAGKLNASCLERQLYCEENKYMTLFSKVHKHTQALSLAHTQTHTQNKHTHTLDFDNSSFLRAG